MHLGGDPACKASTYGGHVAKWRKPDTAQVVPPSVLGLPPGCCSVFIVEWDQFEHSEKSYTCDHNKAWVQQVFDAIHQIYGGNANVFLIRANPDGKVGAGGAGGRPQKVSEEDLVAAVVDTYRRLRSLAAALDAERAQGVYRRASFFISHLFYSASSLQLANEQQLCREDNRFEII